MTKKIYVAYGSNMDMEQMAVRCPSATFIGLSEICGYELLFKGFDEEIYATIERKTTAKVPVVVWEITEEDEQNLDDYEDFPVLYYKKDVSILIENNLLTAMVYIMHENQDLGHPSDDYYKVIEDAYKKFGFDLRILEKALSAKQLRI